VTVSGTVVDLQVFAEASGEFTFRGVPPGTYRVLAVEQPFVGLELDIETLGN
jgi:hypothetical protein